jgi:hypothetical protein
LSSSAAPRLLDLVVLELHRLHLIRQQRRLLLELLVGAPQFLLLPLQQALGVLQVFRLLLEAVVGGLQLFLLALQLLGERLRLLEQVLGTHVGFDGVEHHADGLGELVEEGQVGLAEAAERGELDHRLDFSFEQHRQDDQRRRAARAEHRVHADVVVRHVLHQDALLLQRALPHQRLAEAQRLGQHLGGLGGVVRHQLQARVAVAARLRVQHRLLRVDQRRELREHQLGHRLQVAVTLQHAAELGQVGLQPVLLVVLERGVLQVADHGVDVILQRRHLALRLHRDRPREVALGHRRGHVRDRAHLRGEVFRQLVHVVGEVSPQAGCARHLGLAAQLAFDSHLARHVGHLIGEGREGCRSCR